MNPIIDLEGKVGLITGIANKKSISTGVAEACIQAGAKLFPTRTIKPAPSSNRSSIGWASKTSI